MHNNSSNNVPVGSRSVANQRRFLILKIVFAVAAVVLFFSFLHIVSLRNQISDFHKRNDDDDDQDDDENGADQQQKQQQLQQALKQNSFLSSIFSANKKKNLQTESYNEYSRRAFSSFPAQNDLPSMREHILHLQISRDDTNQSLSTRSQKRRSNEDNNNNNTFDDEKGATIINADASLQNVSEDELKMRKRIKSLARIQEMARSISQKVLRDEGGRKVPNIVGNPVADVKHTKKKGKMHDILNGNNNNNENNRKSNNDALRVFSVQPTISGELDWIPDFVHTDKGNILFKDKLGRRDNVNWFVAEVRHEGKPAWPTRFLLLHELGLTNDVFKFFQKELAFERENKNNDNHNDAAAGADHHKKNRKQESSLSFFTDANTYLINKNPSLELRDNLEVARNKIVSVLGMNPDVLDRSFLVSAVANSPQKNNENGEDNGEGGEVNAAAEKERQVPIDIATNLYDQLELIVRSLQPVRSKSSAKKSARSPSDTKGGKSGEDNDASSHDDNEEDNYDDYDGQVVAISVSSLYKNSEKNDAVIIYLKDQKMKNLPDEMLEDHSIRILTDFIVGNPDSMKNNVNNNNENNNIVGEDDGGVVIRNFLVMCAIAKTENK